MKTKFAIIGGGVAGLCAAIRLCELGEEPLLVEGGSYPSHKICGEFLSPECLSYLVSWKIHPVSISQISLQTSTSKTFFSFPSAAGGLSHLQLDPALANYASSCGAHIRTNTQVEVFQQKKHLNERHLIHLSNGEIIEATTVMIATGRLPHASKKTPPMAYRGFKAHFEHLPLETNTLEMFSLPGAYLGISPIEDYKYNVACLADIKKIQGDPVHFLQKLISQHPRLHSLLSQGKNLFDTWMTAPLPSFGIKQTPNWPDAYFIGDASVAIPPACGNGLSMAILGGCLAAEYATRQQAQDFKKLWTQRCSSQMFWAKMLHHLMLNPYLSSSGFRVANYFPYIAKKMFDLTRH